MTSHPENNATVIDPAALAELVQQWLPAQRWFAGKQRPIETLNVVLLGRMGPAGFQIEIWLARVHYLDGESELYQVPLHLTTTAQESHSRARLGEVRDDGDRNVHVYDAMAGKFLTQAWLHGIVAESSEGGVQFTRVAEPSDIPLGFTSMVLNGEQSNTSAIFGDKAILKVFRRLEIGINPDIEIHEALSRTGGSHIARLLGHASADLGQGMGNFGLVAARAEHSNHGPGQDWSTRASLGMLQDYLSSATDGWVLAKTSVRDLMAEADLHAEEAGGDFAAEAFRLGRATAEVHADLVTAFGTEQLSAQQMRERADAMLARLEVALDLVPQLAQVADQLRACYEALASADPMVVQRVHGDLHLGQVLRTVNRWVLLDFEGEPAKSIAERRQMDSPLRDVAGMLRSFDYAANHQAIDAAADSQRVYRAVEWSERNRNAFRMGYAGSGAGAGSGTGCGAGVDPASHGVLLRAFEADKAVYEAVYEARNRPAWLGVPLASLGRLAAGAASTDPQPGPPTAGSTEPASHDSADREDNR